MLGGVPASSKKVKKGYEAKNLIADLEYQERKACQFITRYSIGYMLRINKLSDEDT